MSKEERRFKVLMSKVSRSRKAASGKHKNAFPNGLFTGRDESTAPTSDVVPNGVGAKSDIFTDHLWSGRQKESEQTLLESKRISASARPLFNKGGFAVPCAFDDPKNGNGRR